MLFWEKKPKHPTLLSDKISKEGFSLPQRIFMLLFQCIIFYALLNFSLLKNLPLCMFMRQLLITAVWHLFNKCTDFATSQTSPRRGICEPFYIKKEDQLVETRIAKKFSDDMFSPEVNALLVHLWRSRREKLHPCSHSKATAGLDHRACSCAEKQTSAACRLAVQFSRQLVHLPEKL